MAIAANLDDLVLMVAGANHQLFLGFLGGEHPGHR